MEIVSHMAKIRWHQDFRVHALTEPSETLEHSAKSLKTGRHLHAEGGILDTIGGVYVLRGPVVA